MAGFRLPDPLNLHEGNIAENFKKWKRETDVYLIASGAIDKEGPQQVAIIQHCGGSQLIETFQHLQFAAAADKTDPEKVFQKIEEYCNPRKNEVLETFRFWNIKYIEPFNQFLQALRMHAGRKL